MDSITMTEFNQRSSAVAREVIESGQAVSVTNRGRTVLRIVPERVGTGGPLSALVDLGLATPPRRPHQPIGKRTPVPLSRDLDEVLAEMSGDAEL